ncbi:MAG: alkaline phosphatase family protein [Clostridiales bacterium]|nr:alkaline phosphatase family protein [Clostridiales bacterium]
MSKIPHLPNYDECLVNLTNSVYKAFGAETSAPTLPLADRYLDKGYKNVVVLLLDAMGVSILEKHLAPDGFFRSHLAGTFSSVFPPTTVAATTSIVSGQYPSEHAWLGWDCYYPKLGKNVTVFLNRDQMQEVGSPFATGTGKTTRGGHDDFAPECPDFEEPLPAADFNVAFTYTPYVDFYNKLRAAGAQGYYATPFVEPYPQTLEDIFAHVKKLCAEDGRKYIYAYWNEPDSTMHRTGTTSDASHEVITDLEKKVEEFAAELSDTLLIVTADHGHMDSKNVCILDYPEIMKCLVRMPSIEPRTLNLFIKDEYKEDFPKIFEKEFGEKFWFLTKEEVIERKLFGPGTENPEFRGMIGDFVAIATSDVSIFNTHLEAALMPGGHAGLSKEELEIPFIAIELPKA